MIKVSRPEEAWRIAHAFIKNLGELKQIPDSEGKMSEGEDGWVSDLNDRLEVNFYDSRNSFNIWIEREDLK